MAVTDAKPLPRYGEPYRVYFPIFNESGVISHVEGVTAWVSLDGGDFNPTTEDVVPIGTSGFFYVELTEDEMMANAVILEFDPANPLYRSTPVILYPEQDGDIRASIIAIGDPATGEIATAVLSANVPGAYNPDSLGGVLGALLQGMPTKMVLVSPVLEGGNLLIVRGDDYLSADGRAITWTNNANTWPDLTNATIYLVIGERRFFRKEISAPTPSGTPKVIQAELTAIETRKLTSSAYTFVVEAILDSGSRVTLLKGALRTIAGI